MKYVINDIELIREAARDANLSDAQVRFLILVAETPIELKEEWTEKAETYYRDILNYDENQIRFMKCLINGEHLTDDFLKHTM